MHKLTIICLTLNRHHYIRRQLLYFADKPIELIIADGSKRSLKFSKAEKLGKMTWKYFNDKSADNYHKRLIKASKLVKTKYVCIIDDADIFLWSGINKIIQYLDKNSNIQCAGGFSANGSLFPKTNSILCKDNMRATNKIIELKSNAPERLIQLISKQLTGAVYYSIIRSKLFLKLVNEVYKKKSSYPISDELTWCALLAINSKIVIKNVPYCIRMDVPSINPNDQLKIKRKNKKLFLDRNQWENNKPNELIKLIYYLANKLKQKGQKNNHTNIEILKKFFEIHKRHFITRFSQSDSMTVTIFKKTFSYLNIQKFWISQSIIKFLNKIFNKKIEMIKFWSNKFSYKLSTHQINDLVQVRSLLSEYPYGVKKLKKLKQ